MGLGNDESKEKLLKSYKKKTRWVIGVQVEGPWIVELSDGGVTIARDRRE